MSQIYLASQVSPGSVIETITGNDGVPESPIGNNFNIVTAGTTVQFLGTPGQETLNFRLSNLIVGSSITAASISGGFNNGFGFNSLASVTTGSSNTACGSNSLGNLTTGTGNVALGGSSLLDASSASFNTALGFSCLSTLTSGAQFNVAVGYLTLSSLASPSAQYNTAIGSQALVNNIGNGNTALGGQAGANCVSNESNNIFIGNLGVSSDNNTIRIGTQGSGSRQQNACYVAGIASTNVSNSNLVTVNATTGQLGAIKYRGVAATGPIHTSDFFIGVTSTAAPVTLTFDNVTNFSTAQMWIIKDESGGAAAHNITIANTSAVNINGSSTYVISANYGSVQLYFNGTQFYTL